MSHSSALAAFLMAVGTLQGLRRAVVEQGHFGDLYDDCDNSLWDAIGAGAEAVRQVPGYSPPLHHVELLAEMDSHGNRYLLRLTADGIECRSEPIDPEICDICSGKHTRPHADTVITRESVDERQAEGGRLGDFQMGGAVWDWSTLVAGLARAAGHLSAVLNDGGAP
ncbi:MAG: hypothetical protein ACLQVI_35910 [Polyangiaceae bacterium]